MNPAYVTLPVHWVPIVNDVLYHFSVWAFSSLTKSWQPRLKNKTIEYHYQNIIGKMAEESWYKLKLFFLTLSSYRVVKKTQLFYDIILPFLQVVSPITGQEIGMQEVRVAKNRESIRGMNVRILTGLGLDVQADPVQRGRYVLRTSYSQLLSSKYQVSAKYTMSSQVFRSFPFPVQRWIASFSIAYLLTHDFFVKL